MLLSSVCGNVALRLREYTEKMPQLRIVFSIMTLNGATNNLQFNQDYGVATRAALRRMATAGLLKMAADSLYPTPLIAEVKAGLTLTASNQVWAPLAQPAQPANALMLPRPPPRAMIDLQYSDEDS